ARGALGRRVAVSTKSTERPTATQPFSVIGKRNRKVEGRRKVTGQLLYTDDIVLPRMLHAKILRSPHPHARIRGIDASRALALPGVHAVVTGRDFPVPYGIIPWTRDEYPLALDKALYVGDGVAAVAADDERTAADALRLIEVEYEILPPVLTVEDALAHPENQVNPFAKVGNVSKHVHLSFGDVEGGLGGADVTVKDTWFYAGSTHAPIEPHCAIGDFGPEGLLTLYSSTQVPHYLHRELARVLEIPMDRIRVIQPGVGGAFGGKSEPFDLEFAVARLSQKTGRPVKILYTREEVFYSHRGRHPMRLAYEIGATREGKLRAVRAKIHIDGGAYSSFGLVTTYYSGQLLCAPYRMPAYEFDSTRVFTNKPACGPKRGHGSVQPRFAFECALDVLAEKLELDPIELRRRNLLGEDTRTVNEMRVTSNGFPQCLDAVERASEWKKKFRRLPYGHGVGVAGSTYISGTNYPIYPNDMPQSGCQIKVDRSGRVTVFSGVSDIGQGCDSTLAYIVAEELGVELEAIRVVAGDTDLAPVDLGAYSSRITFMAGNAALEAARKLKRQVREAQAAVWDVAPDRIELAGGFALVPGDPERVVPVAKAFQAAEARFGTLGSTGSYNTPGQAVHGEYRGGTIGASPAYSFTAHVAEVEVDEETGLVTVKRIWVAHDCGRALNPTLVEGQMEGSAYMGYAEALFEEQDFQLNGLHRGPSLLDYRLPTSLDMPDMDSLIIESVDREGPYGAKEAGEGPLHPSVPAIANAIHDAVGARVTDLPFYPGRVRAAIAARRASGRAWKGRS
ncbi:MAG TPA: xanthine dehydrogenase family protein molybdopterin-binding subunit, partial [Candidatus Eisenbacteria bacterium]|nr:xanthine dehydrogenase family protein molybdopterin-binding subunit [Candidatus Eisenbacteria bacterium]